jgi:MGT family glycosyltransferase
MTRFVFINPPLHAHINPNLPIVQELVARGEEVVYYLTEKYRPAIEATGATFRSYESKLEQTGYNLQHLSQSITLPILMIDESLFVMPQILESVRAERPDCIVYDPMCFSGRFIAEVLQLPAVMTRPTFVPHEQTRRFFQTSAIDPRDAQLFQSLLEQLCARYPIRSFELKDIFLHKAALNIVTMPRSFQPDGASFGSDCLFVGPSIGPRCEAADFPFDQLGQQPIIYVTLGTVYNKDPDFFKACFAAFADQPMQVVVATGRPVEEMDLGPIPGNFIVHRYVPQLEILEHAAISINHGSITTVMEAVSRGVPMVVIPHAIGQEGSARRVPDLGLGILLRKEDATAEALRDAVTRILHDPTFYTRAQAMREEAEAAGGFMAAADALQRFVRLAA